MRTDVKVGIALGAIVLIVAGAYYGTNKDPEIKLAGGDPDVRERNKRTLSELLAPPANGSKAATNKKRPTVGSRKARPEPRASARALEPSAPKSLIEPVAETPRRDPGSTGQAQGDAENLPSAPQATERDQAGRGLPSAETTPSVPKLAVKSTGRRGQPAATDRARNPARSPAMTRTAQTFGNRSMTPSRETAKPGTQTRVHIVALEDNFSALAARYYGSQSYAGFLVNANPSVDPRRMKIGSQVKIPPLNLIGTRAHARNDARELGTKHYSVQEGDSLYAIADARLGAGERWHEIYVLNKGIIGADPSRLTVGVVLSLPAH